MKNIQIKTPKIGLTFSRSVMPQLGPVDKFLDNLKSHSIKYREVKINSNDLKASQGEFNHAAIKSIIEDPRPAKSRVVISNDNYIIDGHHRVSANLSLGKPTKAIRVDLPVLELIRLVKSFDTTQYRPISAVRTIKEMINNR